VAGYQPSPYPGRITLLRAQNNAHSAEAVWPPAHRRDSLGWEAYAQLGLEIVPVPGTHASIVTEPHVQRVAEQLAQRLLGAVHP
jgi:thioesterase domain-containing protein